MQQNYLDDLVALLTRVRRRWVTARSMRAAARAAAAALGFVLLVLAADRFLEPADLVMVALAVVALVGATTFAISVLWPLRRVPSDRQVARYIEEHYPDLEDRLVSAADVAEGQKPSAFRDLMLADAARKARTVDLDQVVARNDVRWLTTRGIAAVVGLIVVLGVGSAPLGRIARTAWLYAFPYTAVLDVEPGDARVVAGEGLRIEAALRGTLGAPARTAPTVTVTADDGVEQTIEMRPAEDGYVAEIAAVDSSFTYRVRAATLVSDDYDVTALFAPRVDQVDVTYEYPAFTGLPPRVELDGGDIYAPADTHVTVTVRMDKPVTRGGLELGSGGRLALRSAGERTLEASFEVRVDDTYRVSAVDRDGLASVADADYFIRTMLDRSPVIEMVRPGGDREMTPLEEVVIEARAEDDFGLERFELVYSVVGQEERAINLRGDRGATSASGTHTVYGEDLGLEPGDFVSYYARARDTNTSRQAAETRSDIYFLEVRPFDQEFEEAQSQALVAMDADGVGNLAEVQKQIIVATWKLDRQDRADRSADDFMSIADAQAELRVTAERMAARIQGRGRESIPDTRGRPRLENTAMAQAVGAMGEAEMSLRAHKTDESIPSEMEALTQLLRAQAEIRRQQVALQQSNQGGRQGASRAREDLSALFDRELRREQRTNYEDRSSADGQPSAEEESEARRRLRELADRQEELSWEQRDLAARESELDELDVKRQLERLTREQNELRQQMEDLQRRMERMQQQGQGGQQADGQRMREVDDQMRRAMSELRRGNVSEAAQRSQQALEALRNLQRQLEEQKGGDRPSQAIGALQSEARQLAEAQRDVASETRQAGARPRGRESRSRLAEQEDRLADRVDSLEDQIEEQRSRAVPEERDALTGASDALREASVARVMRELADELRRGAGVDESSDLEADMARVADATDELGEELNKVADRLAAASGEQNENAQRLSQDLQKAQALRRRLEQIEQRLLQLAESRGETPAGEEPGQSAGQDSEGRSEQQSDRRADSGLAAGAGLARLQEELMRQLAASPDLLEQLSRQRPTLTQDLEQWAQHWRSGPAPGTEAFKQDLSAWEDLRDDVRLALEEFEVVRSRDLTEEETGDRPNLGPNEQTPEEYRQLVEQYYRSLAAEPERR